MEKYPEQSRSTQVRPSPGCSSFCSGDQAAPRPPLSRACWAPRGGSRAGEAAVTTLILLQREELQMLRWRPRNEASLTSLSKSWSGSDILLRGTATPGSKPPTGQGRCHLREERPEPPQAGPPPRTPWYLTRATRCRAYSWAEAAGTSWGEQGQASPPGRGVRHSGRREGQ